MVSDLDGLLIELDRMTNNEGEDGEQPDLYRNRASIRRSLPKKTKEIEAIVAEMKFSPKMQSLRQTNGAVDIHLSESKWRYLGYGIWEKKIREEKFSSTTMEVHRLVSNLEQEAAQEGQEVCSSCQKAFLGDETALNALGKLWHPEHFACEKCSAKLGDGKNFFEREGQVYCEKDYHLLFSPKCRQCGESIVDRCVVAVDATFHPDCFSCAECRKKLGEDGFLERNRNAYCKACFQNEFALRCSKCDAFIEENYYWALNRPWHPDCFSCTECDALFIEGHFFELKGRPYCETHFHQLRGSVCAVCKKNISGRCITAMAKKFHPEHFQCSFCLRQLNKGTFQERNEKPFCLQCHHRLFA